MVTMSYPTAIPPALSHPILYHAAPFYFISLFNAPPLQPRINFTSLCHALYPLRPTHQTTHPLSYCPLPSCSFSSPPVTSHYSLYLPLPYRRFLPLSISSHLATTVSLPFNTFPYPLQTFSYPSHALSIPPRPLPSFRISAHPVTPHSVLFLSIAPLPVFFANPPLSISYPIPFAVFSFPLALFRRGLSPPLHYNHAHPQTLNIAANRGLGIIRSHFRRTSARETASPDFGAIQLTDTPINGPNGSRLTAK